jgi:IclR family transcriptional regulator, acetate operon repressor
MQVKQAANVLDLLEFFAREKRPVSLVEISESLQWPRSSTFNLVATLVDKGYLYEPRGRGRYYPSPRWLSMAQSVADAEPLPDAIVSMVAEIAAETGETTAIGGAAGTSAIFLHVVESPAPIRYFGQVGHRLPIHASSTGRAILEQYSVAERQSLYRKINFERFTDTTPMSIEAVEAEVRFAAERGYHRSNAEFSPDLVGVALPLALNGRRLSVVVAGPMFRCADRVADTAAILRRAITRFSDVFRAEKTIRLRES